MMDKIIDNLIRNGQEHLLTFVDSLSDLERQELLSQIKSIDFELMASLYECRNAPAESLEIADRANDPPSYKFSTVSDTTPCKPRKPVAVQDAVVAGQELLCQGKVGAILVAGGQGTRLGFPHPKGMYHVAPVSGATLFQIHFEKVLAASQQYGCQIPYCIMTSPATHIETVNFLEQNYYFGLQKKDVFIFCQGTMPAVSLETGKILLDSPNSLVLSPDGHGGMLAAITKKDGNGNSVLDYLRQRGIEYLFYNQVDNPLVRICSPEFLGYHILSSSELSSQVIRKHFPTEKVGNIVEVNGKLYVIEYSDLPEEIARKTNADGSLKIWAGSIAVHIFNVALLERTSKIATSLPFHIARKKVPFIDIASGKRVQPEKENAIKFERFIFDLLPLAENTVVVEVDPPNHYAPLKNASGSLSDSPETVQRDLVAMYSDWLRQAGAVVAETTPIEISPLFADSPEIIKKKIKKGTVFNTPTYLQNSTRFVE
jgi:UDP-N-acetylglucosamine/UDP-N-acetylgalactosamine diphosphorylase